VIRWNPSSYHSYMLAADHYKKKKLFRRAAELYAEALKYETATVQEREHLQKNLRYCQEKMQ
jgi:isopenicillin-N N-acyltransferase like protein